MCDDSANGSFVEVVEQRTTMEGVIVKEEETTYIIGLSSSNLSFQPMERLHDVGPPPFLTKTFEMEEDTSTDPIASCSRARNNFVVWDSHKFLKVVQEMITKKKASFVKKTISRRYLGEEIVIMVWTYLPKCHRAQ